MPPTAPSRQASMPPPAAAAPHSPSTARTRPRSRTLTGAADDGEPDAGFGYPQRSSKAWMGTSTAGHSHERPGGGGSPGA
ncbi:hypothetical protein HNR23_002499 [Nocardiopsis mwathae]|uniref:Uncharacterized protein n=1 Tax=Nocardiopsis mwathae TaxID=1472723 RepID=A0A7W9YHY8_9ACTN|nr:hypothetical protein [Nocardiopsis mwathae]